ncbi:MAG: hypothetical protein KDJ90_12650 [Nitratireductor sp.]|nr:hypothetical protein [Nitratireductor sp.]
MFGLLHYLAAGAGAGAMFLAMMTWDAAVDDPAVRREARREYVKLSELEAETARREAAEELAKLNADKLAEERAARASAEQSLSQFEADRLSAEQDARELADELETLRAARPVGERLPSLGDLGVYDRLRQR